MTKNDGKKLNALPKKRMSKRSTVRIPQPMNEAIEDFLKSPVAQSLGYVYKSDIITDAVRDLLKSYGYHERKKPSS